LTPTRPAAEGIPPPSDSSLVRRFRQGSQDAATQLYVRYAQRLRALARTNSSTDLAGQIDPEDIVQSVFGSFFRGINQGYYDVPAGEDLWKLFLVIALNKIRAKAVYYHAAARDSRRTVSGETARPNLETVAATEDTESAFLELALDDALGSLPPRARRIVELRVEGHEVAEIARRTGRSKRTVERILQDARRKLDELLREDQPSCQRE
jgi:RNA polymerase sigma factor (sigma-70 family)